MVGRLVVAVLSAASAEQYSRFVAAERERWASYIRTAKMEPQ